MSQRETSTVLETALALGASVGVAELSGLLSPAVGAPTGAAGECNASLFPMTILFFILATGILTLLFVFFGLRAENEVFRGVAAAI
jgi:hypothetical protein